jgi:hypothetical protein
MNGRTMPIDGLEIEKPRGLVRPRRLGLTVRRREVVYRYGQAQTLREVTGRRSTEVGDELE